VSMDDPLPDFGHRDIGHSDIGHSDPTTAPA
jgi:hypothetical protein